MSSKDKVKARIIGEVRAMLQDNEHAYYGSKYDGMDPDVIYIEVIDSTLGYTLNITEEICFFDLL